MIKAKISFLPVLTLLFIILKLTGCIAWSWIWILAPLWIPFAIPALIISLTVLYTISILVLIIMSIPLILLAGIPLINISRMKKRFTINIRNRR